MTEDVGRHGGGLGCNSEQILSSCIEAVSSIGNVKNPKWRFTLCSWLVLLECTSWWSPASKCFCRIHVSQAQAVALSCFYCCSCCVYFMIFIFFYQWISQPVFSVITSAPFMADVFWVDGFFKQKLHIQQSIGNLFLAGPHWVLLCGILPFLWLISR